MAGKRRDKTTPLTEATEIERTVSFAVISATTALIAALVGLAFQAIPTLTPAGVWWAGSLSIVAIALSGISILVGGRGIVAGPGYLGLRDRFNVQALSALLSLVATVAVVVVAINFRAETPDFSSDIAALRGRIEALEERASKLDGASAVNAAAVGSADGEIAKLRSQLAAVEAKLVELEGKIPAPSAPVAPATSP